MADSGAVRTSAKEARLLEVRDLQVAFPHRSGEIRPVRGVSFGIHRGQRLAIVGESGSGKSLTAFALMRLIRPPGYIAGGEVVLDGRNLLALSEREMCGIRGGAIAMVYQNPLSSLNPVMTIGEQIAEAVGVHQQLRGSAAKEHALALLADVGVQHPSARYGSYPHEFSGGMRQRVVIAMAMAGSPDVLIADEATTALDVTTQARIVDLMLRLTEQSDTALIFITHDLSIASSVCTDVQVMYAGTVVEKAHAAGFYAHPVHPYSAALLQSACGMDTDVTRPLPAIGGQPPIPGHLPTGCPFHPRCTAATVVCAEEEPGLQDVIAGGTRASVRCHHALERASRSESR